MALKFGSVLSGAVSQLGWGDLGSKPSGVVCNWGKGTAEAPSVVFWGLSPHRGIKSLDDRNPSKPGTEMQGIVDKAVNNDSGRMHRDLTSFPKPLSVTDISAVPKDGTKVRISYKGVPGAYSEDAALKAYPHCETVPCDEFEDAFKAVELWLADKAVLPIENSLGGSIHRNYDLLLRHRLHIVGEVQLAVNLCLLALPGVRIDLLRRVLSHPQALAQSDIILSKLGVSRENVDDSAGAAKFVASHGLRDAGVVASARAAEIYGLNILAERIQNAALNRKFVIIDVSEVIVQKQQLPKLVQEVAAAGSLDDSDNITRYLVLAKDPIIPRTNKPFKTSIVFTLEEGPGVLFKALAVFALRDINLTKIESRPQRKKPLRVVDDSNTGSAKYFDYLFYIDFEASMAEPRAQTALAHLQEFATFLRVLGCYPMDSFP